MCGISGIYKIQADYCIDKAVLIAMNEALQHRGPDEASYYNDGNAGFSFRRLSIVDVKNGHQPFFSDDDSVVLICNGEIYNYRELRQGLARKGYAFKTNCDVEVVLHLYLEYGTAFLDKLNGQFSFAIYDKNRNLLFIARDHFGICPLFYTVQQQFFAFSSEIKALLKHPRVGKKINLKGLDQILSFPGLVGATTMFENIHCLKPGHYLLVSGGQVSEHQYWDVNYPAGSFAYEEKPEAQYLEQLEALLIQSVRYRMQADVPIGLYLSGGLDSSLIGALMQKIAPGQNLKTFSFTFPDARDKTINERRYQRLMAEHLGSVHQEVSFDPDQINKRLREVVYFAESPLKETYNVCSLALSATLKRNNIKVALCGEGADELFGGYLGYAFDSQRNNEAEEKEMSELLEDEVREELWGDPGLFYEKNYYEFKSTKRFLYSAGVSENLAEFDCYNQLEINRDQLKDRHVFHQRSYLDMKLRLAGHLIADHGDRMNYASGVEGRYPFLDINLVEFVKALPPGLKLNKMVEKYLLKEIARKYVPAEIVNRQKFGFVAPGSSQLLKQGHEWLSDLLSYSQIKRQGYFNADTVERLKKLYSSENFILNVPYEDDLLSVVITFGLLLEVFDLPAR